MITSTITTVLSLVSLFPISSAYFHPSELESRTLGPNANSQSHDRRSSSSSSSSKHSDRRRSPHNPNNAHRQLLSRSITADVTAASGASYDFIVAGGGLAGLAVAARLSEWSNVTVLVIEAGSSGDEFEDQIDIPGYSYLHSLGGTAYDWNYTTVAQTDNLDRKMSWPRGRGLGGSGAVNGLYWCWAGKEDYQAWADLNPNAEETWNWDEMFKYMKKSETFTPPPNDIQQEMGMVLEQDYHGYDGPIQIGFSEYMYDTVKTWIPSWEAIGFKSMDLFGGDTHGAAITPSTLNAKNQTRSDSRAGYIDPLPPRDNLVILTNQQVTEIIWSDTPDSNGNKVAAGVKFAAGKGQQEYVVQANKEVILSGGTIGSAQILQLSGVGPKDKLAAAGVQSVVDLPVGYNLQDHISFSMYWSTPPGTLTWSDLQNNQTLQAEQLTQYKDSQTGMWTFINEAIAYPAMTDMMSASEAADYAATVKAAIADTAADVTSWQNLPSGVSASLAKQYAIMQEWLTTGVGQVEFLLTMLGQNGAQDQIGIQMALQHPWSRGSIFITSSDPFTAPAINPDYFGVGYDIDIMGYAAELARKLAGTAPMSSVALKEVAPGANMTGDALGNWTRQTCGTEYHPLGTCSMLPKDEGGVVDTTLTVYGTSNVRVIDSSIMPLHISAHNMASTYGIAEKGADIIKAKHFATTENGKTSSDSGDASTTAKPGVATDKSVTHGSGNDKTGFAAMSLGAKIGIGVGAGVGALAVLGALILFCCMRSKRKQQDAAAAAYGWQGFGHEDSHHLRNKEGFDGYSGDSTPLHDFSRSTSYAPSPSPTKDFSQLPALPAQGGGGISYPLESRGMAGMGAVGAGGYDDYSVGQPRPGMGMGMGMEGGYSNAQFAPSPSPEPLPRGGGGGGYGAAAAWEDNTPSWAQSPTRQVYQPVVPR